MESRSLAYRFGGLLPVLTLLAGTGILWALGSPLAWVAAGLTAGSAVVEWRRRSARNRVRMEQDALQDPDDPVESDTQHGLVMIRWRDKYNCGHPVIDRQHRVLFQTGNELVNAVLGRAERFMVEDLMRELIEHIEEHFDTEEAVLTRTGYPMTTEHRDIHAELLGRARSLEERYREGSLPSSELVGFIAYDVIAGHVIREDLKFALREVGPKLSEPAPLGP